ncbi:hypothetical protein EV1_011545 [Malus domestica]
MDAVHGSLVGVAEVDPEAHKHQIREKKDRTDESYQIKLEPDQNSSKAQHFSDGEEKQSGRNLSYGGLLCLRPMLMKTMKKKKEGGGEAWSRSWIGSRGSRKRGRRPQFVDRGLMVVALSDTTAGQTTGKKMEEIHEFRGFKSDDGGEISSRPSPESKSPSVDFNFDLDLAHRALRC